MSYNIVVVGKMGREVKSSISVPEAQVQSILDHLMNSTRVVYAYYMPSAEVYAS